MGATALNTLSGVANGRVNVEGHTVAGNTDAGSYEPFTPGTVTVKARNNIAVDATFNTHFPWGATASGAAHGMIKVTLPLGLDGNKFRMHLQTVGGKQLGIGAGISGQVYVHRARNNNGRTFEVTQAYENKVAGMTHFSKANAAMEKAGGAFAIATDTMGSAMGSLIIKTGTAPASGFNPGTYYNVKLSQDGTSSVTGVGSGIYAKVVVKIGGVAHVEITAGGLQVKLNEVYTIKCDPRIHTDFIDTGTCPATAADTIRQDVQLNDSSDTADKQNIVLPGIRVGAASVGTPGGTLTATCGIGEIGRRFSESGAAVATGGMLVNIQTRWICDGLAGVATELGSVIALTPGAPKGDGTLSTKAELEEDCIVALKNVGGTNGKTGQGDVTAKFAKADLNTFYYQAGFYDTVTPQFNQDALHANSLNGGDVQESDMMAVMGGRQSDGAYPYTSYVGGGDQQLFGGLKDVASRGNGNGRRSKLTTLTSSLLVGSQGKVKTLLDLVTLANTFSEHMDKYAYVGRGFDQLTVTPAPDAMDSMKLEVTYHGAAGACSVTEVGRGTHESSVCSGRGNCDFSTGTCLCDAGYTLEACSEQTVLV